MIQFTVSGDALYAKMERAVERVTARLRQAVRILESAGIPYAVIGGHAIRAWVAQVDEAALRTTQDVDILVRPVDFSQLVTAMMAAGFHHRKTSGLEMFVEHLDASARDAIHVLLVGAVERAGDAPNPDIEPSTIASEFRTLPLETLVWMKLNSFRRKDQVHLLDLIALGLIDPTWTTRFEPKLAARLQSLLDDPDG